MAEPSAKRARIGGDALITQRVQQILSKDHSLDELLGLVEKVRETALDASEAARQAAAEAEHTVQQVATAQDRKFVCHACGNRDQARTRARALARES